MEEIWKDIKEYEGLYQVSNLGNVRSLNYNRQKITKQLRPYKNIRGYWVVSLFKNNKQKTKMVHRLVAESFIENIENNIIVNHKDGNKNNNCADNLEWCTPQYNIKEAFRMGLNKPRKGTEHHLSRKVKQYDLDGNFIRKWDCFRDIERELGFKHSNISACCNGKYDKMYGYRWKYAEYIDKDIIANKINKNKELLDETNDGDLRQKIIVENEALKELLEGE